MITREQFGPYLLLKKLSEDPLGETFRAGLMGSSAMERVVLLRVFNGSALEGQDLWPLVQESRDVQQALRSPNIGSGVGLGQVQGVPFAAYDYISGKNLAQVFEQVVRGNHPVPVEHALLIAERLALGLAVAYETRVDSERVLHGFLVPQLVLLSNEGEIRLLGFEVGPCLRQLTPGGLLRESFGRYQSPESLAGQAPSSGDDVYSLGAVLLQLLLGRQLPAPAADTYQSLIQEVTERGLPEVADLLRRSLAPAGDRISDVVTWHKGLSKILIDGQYKATTFNLAFFMHNLFRDEIEKETREIEVERAIKIPVAKKGSEVEPTPAPDLVEALAREDLSDSTLQIQPVAAAGSGSSARKKRPAWWVLVAAVVIVGLGVGAYFAWSQLLAPRASPETETPPLELAAVTPAGRESSALAPTEGAGGDELLAGAEGDSSLEEEGDEAPPGLTPEEILERIDTAVTDRTRSMEQSLRAQYDDEIAALRAQLEAARQAQLEAQRRAQRPPSRPPQATPAGPISPTKTSRTPASGTPDPSASAAASGDTRAAATTDRPSTAAEVQKQPSSTRSSTPTAASPNPPPTTTPGSLPAPGNGRPQPESSRTAAQPATPSPSTATPSDLAQRSPPRPRVRRGDLVVQGPGVTPPKLEGRLEPRYPIMAEKLKREASVLVSVLVDENGRVLEAKLIDDKVGFGFDEAALQAARRARFEPARKDGVVVKTWTNLKIEFRLQ